MLVGVPKETYPGEALVALVPSHVPLLTKIGLQIVIESGAGEAAGFEDDAYCAKGAHVTKDRAELFNSAGLLLQVRTAGANPERGREDLPHLRNGHILIGMADPFGRPEASREMAERGVTLFAMELIPRIARAQSMDVLSSLATIAGYKSVLLAADRLPKLFPMLTTAAGTIPPARVLVIGAGVAGLQAIATARRLGAAVSAYDVRAAAREQIQSLGAKAVVIPVETADVEDSGGYAKVLSDTIFQRQREYLAPVLAASDVVISTAAVPGRPAPILIPGDLVARMARGSVIVDAAADRGGNCELTCPGKVVVRHGVTVLGPTNLASTVPTHASQMYGRNLVNVLLHLWKHDSLCVDMEDEITRGTLVTRDGAVVHPRVQDCLPAV